MLDEFLSALGRQILSLFIGIAPSVRSGRRPRGDHCVRPKLEATVQHDRKYRFGSKLQIKN